MRGIVFIIALFAMQDPYKVAPRNYRLEFENDHTRVSRATLRPGDKVPMHDHPAWSTVYVYLTDGGHAKFSHVSPKFSIERPAVKAGGIRVNLGMKETHRVEYLGTAPSEYLRIELKDDPALSQRTTRLAPDEPGPIETAKIRIRRLSCPAVENCVAEYPALVVSVEKRSGNWVDAGQSLTREPSAGSLILILMPNDNAGIQRVRLNVTGKGTRFEVGVTDNFVCQCCQIDRLANATKHFAQMEKLLGSGSLRRMTKLCSPLASAHGSLKMHKYKRFPHRLCSVG